MHSGCVILWQPRAARNWLIVVSNSAAGRCRTGLVCFLLLSLSHFSLHAMGIFIQRLACGTALLLAGSLGSLAQSASSPTPPAANITAAPSPSSSAAASSATTASGQPLTVVQAPSGAASPAPI